VRKRPFVALPWDARSDQPDRMRVAADKRLLRRIALGEYARTAALAACAAPLWLTGYLRLAAGRRFPGAGAPARQPWADFLGVAVSPGHEQARLRELIDELGVRRLSIRVPVWQRDNCEELMRFIAGFDDRRVLAVLCQDRGSVCDHQRWRADCRRIFAALPDNVDAVQVGNAVNRRKWGCAHIGEYLDLLAIAGAEHARSGRRTLLAGSAVIDFEPVATLRSLLHRRAVRLDACSALLYVDRRGAPDARQYGYFDTARKIRAVASAVALSRRCADRLWLTEVNWPLAGHGAYAPTAPELTVDEQRAGDYLRRYCQIAYASGYVQRVYVWQLVARGYGLVDPDDAYRRRPAFDAVRDLLRAGQAAPQR